LFNILHAEFIAPGIKRFFIEAPRIVHNDTDSFTGGVGILDGERDATPPGKSRSPATARGAEAHEKILSTAPIRGLGCPPKRVIQITAAPHPTVL
jgi:hypothetical protein